MSTNFTLFKNAFFSLVLIFLSCPGEAAIFSEKHPLFGSDSLTIDTITRYAWLDLTLTINLSINDVNLELTKGGLYEGFRYATQDEVYVFLNHAGVQDLSGTATVSNYAPIEALINLLGNTQGSGSPQFPPTFSTGISSTVDPRNFSEIHYLAPSIFLESNGTGKVGTSNSRIDERNVQVGSWLVNTSTIPVPAPLFLLSIGLVILSLLRLRRA